MTVLYTKYNAENNALWSIYVKYGLKIYWEVWKSESGKVCNIEMEISALCTACVLSFRSVWFPVLPSSSVPVRFFWLCWWRFSFRLNTLRRWRPAARVWWRSLWAASRRADRFLRATKTTSLFYRTAVYKPTHCKKSFLLRVNPISLSYPFPLPLTISFARSRESKGCPNSGFDRGVGLRGSGRYPLKPSIFASLLETKGYPEHTAQPATTSARSSRESHFRLK